MGFASPIFFLFFQPWAFQSLVPVFHQSSKEGGREAFLRVKLAESELCLRLSKTPFFLPLFFFAGKGGMRAGNISPFVSLRLSASWLSSSSSLFCLSWRFPIFSVSQKEERENNCSLSLSLSLSLSVSWESVVPVHAKENPRRRWGKERGRGETWDLSRKTRALLTPVFLRGKKGEGGEKELISPQGKREAKNIFGPKVHDVCFPGRTC